MKLNNNKKVEQSMLIFKSTFLFNLYEIERHVY